MDPSESPSSILQSAKSQFLNLLGDNEKGITDKTLGTLMESIDIAVRAQVINDCLAAGKIELLKQGKQLIYKLKVDSRQAFDNDEENVVYTIIEEAGNRGIWMREIRTKSKLPITQLSKVLKTMENKKMIKSVKSISAYKKKVYMLYNLEPCTSVTGGTWYSNNDFESEFVEILNQQCYKYLVKKFETSRQLSSPIERKNASYCKSSEICDYIRKLGISKVNLSEEDIEEILETLVYDGKVEKTCINDSNSPEDGTTKIYRAINPSLTMTSLMRMPCGVCPVASDCHIDGFISPIKCIYFNDYFEF
ncbi:DNA-directed RNA polymerase III subunit RPC6-like [Panonychus citri]|uniref:DNA-directed RNA polymerase III subunit RPC6-like n=1 Tax=Panonychus citri TaxID=50023 RepID=UPI002307E241|nr:DNA-directed RNA polymerase III subunit RPC6-like [Panonychus citri]